MVDRERSNNCFKDLSVNTDSLVQGGRDVLQLGARALEAVNGRSADAVDVLESYSEALSAWQIAFQSVTADGQALSSDQLDVAKLISEQHNSVVEAARDLHGDLGNAVKNLGGWMRGVRAYTDHLPKRLSTIKPQKG